MTDVDVVVVGLGPGGEAAATKLAHAGLEVVGVDERLVGGECPFYGCTPSKLFLTASDLVGDVGRADRLAGPAEVAPEWSRVRDRISQATHDWHDDGHVEGLEEAGVRIARGHGRLDGPGRVVVGDEVLTARRGIVLNPGTRPSVPPIDGLEGTPYWTNRDVFSLDGLPASMVVLGGGPVGLELAQAFSRFGVDVTVVEMGPRILAADEPEASELLTRLLQQEGIAIRTCDELRSVEYAEGFRLDVDGDRVQAEALLVATGRTPNLDGLGLGTIGLDPTPDTLETDEWMRVVDGVYAVGDVTGHGAFTHLSISQADAVVAHLLGRDGPVADHHAVARATFSDPEVGAVGVTEQQAREAGIDVRVASSDLAESSRGWIQEAQGLVKVVADAERGVLVGATVVGPAGGEILGMLSLAVHARVPVPTFAQMHFAYPTLHRAAQVALEDLDLG